MLTSDLVGELRAEVTRWWEGIQKSRSLQAGTSQSGDGARPSPSSPITPILGGMLGDGPIRMITQGQELTGDVDAKTLSEMQFKDNQVRMDYTPIARWANYSESCWTGTNIWMLL